MNSSVVYTVKARQDVQQRWQVLSGERSQPRRPLPCSTQSNLEDFGSYPGIGMLCDFELKSVAALRQMPLERPSSHWLRFYLPRQTSILVFRVAHGARDLPALFQ